MCIYLILNVINNVIQIFSNFYAYYSIILYYSIRLQMKLNYTKTMHLSETLDYHFTPEILH